MRESRDAHDVYTPHDALPFLDAELLDTRRKQRQQLASIPDWILEEGRGFPSLYPEREVARPSQPALVELRLRRSAKMHLDQLAGLLEHGNRLSGAAATRRFLIDWAEASAAGNGEDGADADHAADADDGDDSAEMNVEGLLQDSIDFAEREHLEQAAFIEHMAANVTHDAWQAVALLALADVLAGDGYRDPRLR